MNKRALFALFIVTMAVASIGLYFALERADAPAFAPNEFIVKSNEGCEPENRTLIWAGYIRTDIPSIDFLNARYRINSMERLHEVTSEPGRKYGLHRVYVLKSSRYFKVLQAVQDYSNDANVEYVEPNWMSHPCYLYARA